LRRQPLGGWHSWTLTGRALGAWRPLSPLDRRTIEPYQKIERKEHESAQRCEKWRVWYIEDCYGSESEDRISEHDNRVANTLCEVEGEVDQQGRNKEDAKEGPDLKEGGEFVKPEHRRLERICAVYHEHQEKEQEIDERGQAR
jgi:hypothetical protein